MMHPEDFLPPIASEGYHCPTCAALGYLGTHIDRLEAGLREGVKELDSWIPSESSKKLRGILADALGEP